MSLAWQNIGKTLSCRAVIFDRRALTFVKGEKAAESNVSALGAAAAGLGTSRTKVANRENVVATGKVKDLLQSEIRDELKARGANPIGKRWEISQRLQELLDQEATADKLLPGATPDPESALTGKEHAAVAKQEAPSVRDKYSSQLSAKLAATLARKGLGTAMEHEAKGETASEKWNLQPGVRELLQYVEMRGMLSVLLPFEVDSDLAAEEQGRGISDALKVSPFAIVAPLDLTEALRRGEGPAVHRLTEMLELDAPKRMMFVSDERKVINAAVTPARFSSPCRCSAAATPPTRRAARC